MTIRITIQHYTGIQVGIPRSEYYIDTEGPERLLLEQRFIAACKQCGSLPCTVVILSDKTIAATIQNTDGLTHAVVACCDPNYEYLVDADVISSIVERLDSQSPLPATNVTWNDFIYKHEALHNSNDEAGLSHILSAF